MKKIREFIKELDFDTIVKIRLDRNQFEKEGFIEECTLREISRKYMEDNSIPEHTILWIMNIVAYECDRNLADRYISYEIGRGYF